MFWQALTFLGVSFGLGENEVVWCQANTAWGQISRFHSPHGLSPPCKHKKGLGTKRCIFSLSFLLILYSFPPHLNEEVSWKSVSLPSASWESVSGPGVLLPIPATCTEHRSVREEWQGTSVHVCPPTRVCHPLPAAGALSVRAATEGIILDHIIIAASQWICCFIGQNFWLMKYMKSPKRAVVWTKLMQVFRDVGSEMMTYQ